MNECMNTDTTVKCKPSCVKMLLPFINSIMK